MPTRIGLKYLVGVLVVMTCLASCTEQPQQTEPALPESGFLPGTALVIWQDLLRTGPSEFDQLREAFRSLDEDAWPDDEYEQFLSEYGPAHQRFTDVGIRAMVISLAYSEDTEAQAPPSVVVRPQVFLNVAPNAKPAKVKQALIEGFSGFDPTGEVDTEPLESLEVLELEEGWLAVVGGPFAEPSDTDDTLISVKFMGSFYKNPGACAHVTWNANQASIRYMRELLNKPEMIMFAGVLISARSLEEGTCGVWLGSEPKVRVSMRFRSPKDARLFNSRLSDTVMTMTGLARAAYDLSTPEAQRQALQKQAEALTSFVTLDQQGTILSKTIDISALKQLKQVEEAEAAKVSGPDTSAGQDAEGD